MNVPYDSGVVVCADPAAHRAALGVHGPYLIQSELGDPADFVPELSRRGREIVIWAALRSLGRCGVEDLLRGLTRAASRFAAGVRQIPGAEVLNDVVYTQVCVGFASDELTTRVVRRVLEDATAWMSGSRWRDQAVLRVSVSNAATTDADVDQSLAALARIVAEESHSGEARYVQSLTSLVGQGFRAPSARPCLSCRRSRVGSRSARRWER